MTEETFRCNNRGDLAREQRYSAKFYRAAVSAYNTGNRQARALYLNKGIRALKVAAEILPQVHPLPGV